MLENNRHGGLGRPVTWVGAEMLVSLLMQKSINLWIGIRIWLIYFTLDVRNAFGDGAIRHGAIIIGQTELTQICMNINQNFRFPS